MKITCTKRYDDLPFAHRQPKHDGHCAWIHGHNWSFAFTFYASILDECGFVIDFGKLKWLKAWLLERFDHTLLLNTDDPKHDELTASLAGLSRIITVPDCSCEGLAAWLLSQVNTLMLEHTNGRVGVLSVVVIEDSKNHATATL